MVHFGASGENRDDTATDRDDAAEGRDVAATDRDAAATERDDRAGGRDDRAGRDADDLRDRLTRTSRQAFDRFAGDDVVVDPADWPELTAAGLARLRAFAAEQRLLGALDHAAVRALCDDLRGEIEHGRLERRAAARDREAATADRRAADRDRGLAEQDRADAARDRDQAAIERQQDSPVGLLQPDGTDESLAGRVARAMADSRRRITDSRAYLAGDLDEARPTVPDPDTAASAPDA
jgi:hypothetical protein